MLDVPHSYFDDIVHQYSVWYSSLICLKMCIRLNYPVIITLGVDAVHVYANATYIVINITHASVIWCRQTVLDMIFTVINFM